MFNTVEQISLRTGATIPNNLDKNERNLRLSLPVAPFN